ncbi:hypothetical protein KCU98_g1848, partial [Aureobasidium melanogenum]
MMPTTSTYTEKTTYTTIFTTDYVTVCPTPTVVTINKQTITVTASTTLTVPCPTTQVKTDTITKSVVMTPSPVPASSMPAPPASSMPASSMPVAPASTMPAPANTCPPAQTVTVTQTQIQYVTVSKQQETSMAPSSAPASSMPQSSAPASSMKPSSAASSAVMSSKPASSASSKPASSAPAPSASATGKCPLDLKAGAYEYPHALRVNGVNGYNITINKDTKTDVGFDIPQGDAGKTCSTYFSLPKASDLATSGYSLSGSGMINVSKDGKVIYSFAPQPGNAYLIESGACAAGKFVTYTFSTADSVDVNLFNDYNPCALGAFVTVA